jgi:site-specific DNA recombinase
MVQGTHTPMVSKELWDRVQAHLSSRPGKHRETKHLFPYGAGLMTCGKCGCTITAELKKSRFVYYRCTGYREAHPLEYVREEALTEQFAGALGALHFDDEVLDWPRIALRGSHEVQKREHDDAVERPQAEHKRLEDRLHTMYTDKLDGRISADFFDQKAAEMRSEQARMRGSIEQHKAANDQYLDVGVKLLELANRAPELFRSSKPMDKRELLGFVLSNCQLTDGKLAFTYRQPFDMLVDTVKAANVAQARRPLSGARLAIWGG